MMGPPFAKFWWDASLPSARQKPQRLDCYVANLGMLGPTIDAPFVQSDSARNAGGRGFLRDFCKPCRNYDIFKASLNDAGVNALPRWTCVMNRAPPPLAEFPELLGVSSTEAAKWDRFLLQIVDNTPLQARVCFRDLALGVICRAP